MGLVFKTFCPLLRSVSQSCLVGESVIYFLLVGESVCLVGQSVNLILLVSESVKSCVMGELVGQLSLVW